MTQSSPSWPEGSAAPVSRSITCENSKVCALCIVHCARVHLAACVGTVMRLQCTCIHTYVLEYSPTFLFHYLLFALYYFSNKYSHTCVRKQHTHARTRNHSQTDRKSARRAHPRTPTQSQRERSHEQTAQTSETNKEKKRTRLDASVGAGRAHRPRVVRVVVELDSAQRAELRHAPALLHRQPQPGHHFLRGWFASSTHTPPFIHSFIHFDADT